MLLLLSHGHIAATAYHRTVQLSLEYEQTKEPLFQPNSRFPEFLIIRINCRSGYTLAVLFELSIFPRTMTPSHISPQAENAIALIQQWQAATSTAAENGGDGIIARLASSCLALFSALLIDARKSKGISRKAKNVLSRSHATLKLWVSGHDVLNGHLDSMLERSQRLRLTTLATLNSLCGLLINGKCNELLRIITDYNRAQQGRLASLG
jgi:hypothetical protein